MESWLVPLISTELIPCCRKYPYGLENVFLFQIFDFLSEIWGKLVTRVCVCVCVCV